MRWVLMLGAGLALAGCAERTYPPPGPEQIEALRLYQQRMANRTPAEIETERRTRQAEIICQNRGRAAAAQPAYGGPGMPGLANAMVSQEMAGNAVASACWDTFQRTGVMPSY